MSQIRLDKYLADAGHGTRSRVKDKIRLGSVRVNGCVVTKPETKLDTQSDCVEVDGRRIGYSEFEYFMLNKPQGVVSATTDNRDKTVVELIAEEKRRDLFPVGRLDKDTEGLILITNDGVLANGLLAPGKHVDKQYYARIRGKVTDDSVISFRDGLDIGDDKPTAPAKLEIINSDAESEVLVMITEGRYHQIKRMFAALDMKVLYLKRLSMGPVKLDESLSLGEYRRLTEEEIKMLREVHG